jgi:hypothetical protein
MLLAVMASIVIYSYLYFKGWKLKRYRVGNLESFLKYFEGEEVAEDILICVYRCMQSLMFVKDFPVHPKDNLKIYWHDDLIAIDVIFNLTRLCKCKEPTDEDLLPVKTIEDLVWLLAKLPKFERQNDV